MQVADRAPSAPSMCSSRLFEARLNLLLLLLLQSACSRRCRQEDIEVVATPVQPLLPHSCAVLDVSHGGLCKWWKRVQAHEGKADSACQHTQALRRLGNALHDVPRLHEMRVEHVGLDANAAEALVQTLRGDGREGAGPSAHHNTKVPSRLSFSNNHIGDKGVMRLAQLFHGAAPHSHPGLWPPRIVDLTHNGVGDEGVSALAGALMRDDAAQISELTLWHNDIGANGAAALAKIVAKQPSTLRKLRLWHNNVGSQGAAHIAKAFVDNPFGKLQTLDLAFNSIDDEGAIALADAIAKSPELRLEQIELSSNMVGDRGAERLAAALRSNTYVTRISLDNNEVSDEHAAILQIRSRIERNMEIRGKVVEL